MKPDPCNHPTEMPPKTTTNQRPSEVYAARKKRGRPTVAFVMDDEVMTELRAYSEASGRSMSSIVVAAVRAYLGRVARR